jgi:DNA-binding MarR family transcriptional regulator
MEYDDEDLKILELINRGVKTFRDIKNILKVKNDALEKTLGILDQSQMIKTNIGTGLLGQKKINLELTDAGKEKIEEEIKFLTQKWQEMLDLAIAGERETLDQMIVEHPKLVNVMVFFGITDLPTLSRLNLRFLLEGKHLCYKCKKELGRFSQKFSVSDVRKFNFKLPRGMTTRDDLCADCFNKLPPAGMEK